MAADSTLSTGGVLRAASGVVASSLPLLIIGCLLYAAFFIKWEPEISQLQVPPIERRDVFYGVAAPGAGVVWAVGSYGKIVRSDDGGEHWKIQPTPAAVHLQAISAWDAERAVVVGNGGDVLVTSDGGNSWRSVDAPHSEIANKLLQVRTLPNGTAWAVGEVGAVLRTQDYGEHWRRVLEEKDQAWNDIFMLGADGWMVGEFGAMLRTRDGGESWSPMSGPLNSSLMSVRFRDPQNGVAVGLSGAVLITRDGGDNWLEVPRVTREHLNSVLWDGRRWIAVGDKGVRLIGSEDGAHWKGGRISDKDLSWRTQIIAVGDRYYLAGSNLAKLDGDHLHIFGRD